jgi:hypothetical protein
MNFVPNYVNVSLKDKIVVMYFISKGYNDIFTYCNFLEHA